MMPMIPSVLDQLLDSWMSILRLREPDLSAEEMVQRLLSAAAIAVAENIRFSRDPLEESQRLGRRFVEDIQAQIQNRGHSFLGS